MEQRSRGGRGGRRKTLPSSSFQSDTSVGADSTSTVMTRSPPAPASRTPQTAPPNRRASKPAPMNNPFINVRSSPSTAAAGPGKAIRKKSRSGAADEDDETYRKGPHTLRKRTKIDYSAADFEDELPEIAIPAPRTATRKRRADSEVVDDDYFTPLSQKRRATSRDFSVASLPAARRRTPARKNVVEQQQSYSQPSDEDIVKDTIEVVGDSSDLVSSDDASDHEEDEHDISGHPALPEKHHQHSSPTQRKTKDINRLASPVEQNIIKQQQKEQSFHTQHVSAAATAAAEHMDSGPVIAHPQPIRVNHVSIFNDTAPVQEARPIPTHREDLVEDFSFQPKREASSPVRPTATALHQAVEPETAKSTTGQQVVLGSQENSAPAVVADSSDTTTTTAAPIITLNEVAIVAQSPEQIPDSTTEPVINGEGVNGHVDATENKPSPREQPPSPEPAAGPSQVKTHESFTSQPDEAVSAQDRMDVDAPEEPVSEMQKDTPVEQPDTAHSPEEAPKELEIKEPEDKKPQYPWSYLTPYISGEFVTHSTFPVIVEAPAPTSNPDGLDANGETENAEENAEGADANVDGPQADGEGEEDGNADADGEVEDVNAEDTNRAAGQEEDHQPDSQAHQLSQQLSQESRYNSEAPTPALTPRQGSPALPSTAITGTSTPALAGPRQRLRKQYPFKKVRDPAEYMEFLKDTKKLSYEELWDLLAEANDALLTWQEEYKECTKIVDDQENAQRRQIQDAAFEKKTADLNVFNKVESYIEKDFDIQGYRATIKEKDAGVLEQRWQDRVMASVYGFEYDPHPNKIGNQDPDTQKDGGGEGRQLRSQPQASAKAAEGDGVIVSGKRARNPPKPFEGVVQEDRSATPGGNKAGPKRRGRAAAADRFSTSFTQDEPEAEPEPQTVSPARPGRKRGPRGKRVVIESEPNTPVPEQDAIAPPPPEPEPQEPPKRKRGRQAKAKPVEEPAPEPEERTPKRARTAKRQSNGHVPPPETTDESRPTSSSSNATISDDGSTYGLRQNKRQKNWREEADVEEEAVEAMQPQKRPRIRLNRKQSAADLTPKKSVSERILADINDFQSAPTPEVSSLVITFKLIGKDQWSVKGAATPRQTSTDESEYNLSTPKPMPVSAPASAKSSAPPSQAGGEEKDYSTMTKSEKMSASMKKRWLNGSMQGAVNKRKATLAAKKAAAAAAEAQQVQQAQVAQQKTMQFQHHTGILPMPPNHGQ